jgi:micrococcal nuclease
MRLFLFLLLCIASAVYAEEFDARVIAVMDGDTVLVLRDGNKIKVRMANIDAPELAQVHGKESRQALVERVLQKKVRIKSQAVDSYGRMIAELSVDGRSVNEEQLQNGMAWEYSHYHSNKRLLSLTSEAQQAQRGLWGQPVQAIAPEQWRKTHPVKLHPSEADTSVRKNSVCGKKRLCRQMISCEEAKIYFLHCGVKSLDGNNDGVPCESLCAPEPVMLP